VIKKLFHRFGMRKLLTQSGNEYVIPDEMVFGLK